MSVAGSHNNHRGVLYNIFFSANLNTNSSDGYFLKALVFYEEYFSVVFLLEIAKSYTAPPPAGVAGSRSSLHHVDPFLTRQKPITLPTVIQSILTSILKTRNKG
ncbi:unnamed protein product [Danaus chrysippus]|uniref:(African queen) hypothetical protein n=1 Tax=Danaus chrysippus TaxID=151541 RepID=A0A8J2QNF8_9NEOP|nr:unnamed protein product [Danaus chrysippus]